MVIQDKIDIVIRKSFGRIETGPTLSSHLAGGKNFSGEV